MTWSGEAATTLRLGAIRYYARRKLIAPSEFRGNLTRYQRRELLRLLAIPRLQYEQRLSLAAIKQFLDRLGDTEVLAWLMERSLSAAAAVALGVATASPPAAPTPTGLGAPDSGLSSTASTMWHRVALLPGLELMCASTASPAVRAAAQKIFEEYVGK